MENAKPLARAGYLLAAALVVIPITDALLPLLPSRLGDDRWRWGVVGQLSNVMLFPLVGLLMVMAVATLADRQRAKRIAGAICAVLAVILSVVTIFFIIDFSGVRAGAAPALRRNIAIASSIALVKNLLTILTLTLLSWSGFAGPRISRGPARTGKFDDSEPGTVARTAPSRLVGVGGESPRGQRPAREIPRNG